MNHASSRELYAYWDQLRGAEPAPKRGDVDPGFLKRILADTFILEVDGEKGYPYRLAGTQICAAYCREMKSRDYLADFSANDRERLAPILENIVARATPLIMTVTAWTGRGQRLAFECLLLPLRHAGARYDRLLGVFAPMERPYWLGTVPLIGQEITGLRQIGERRGAEARREGPAILPPAARPGSRRPPLVLLEGGKI